MTQHHNHATSQALQEEIRYLYDGWNVIAELDDSLVISRNYLWGLDLTQTMQGAGGIGGLLAAVESSGSVYEYLYDGDGDVTGILDDSGRVVATYAYNVFGRVEGATGHYKDTNRFQYSTKAIESWVTNHYYFGYRYYDPINGRWLSRDPLDEKGGANIYGFVENDPANSIEYLGEFPFKLVIVAVVVATAVWAISKINERKRPQKLPDGSSKKYTGKGIVEVTVEDCSIVILDGHGARNVAHKFNFKGNSAGAFVGCYPSTTNSEIPDANAIPFAPMHSEEVNDGKTNFMGARPKDEDRRELWDGALVKARSLCNSCNEVKIVITDQNWKSLGIADFPPDPDVAFTFECDSGRLMQTHRGPEGYWEFDKE